jgi:hypothetical protein
MAIGRRRAARARDDTIKAAIPPAILIFNFQFNGNKKAC